MLNHSRHLFAKTFNHEFVSKNVQLLISFTAFLSAFFFCSWLFAASDEFGFSKVEITPTTPIRLSGYGNRAEPYTGIDEPLFARAMAIRSGETNELSVLVSVDTIGFPAILTKEIHAAVQKKHGLQRSRFVICCTHSHTAPHILRGLSNLYSTPLSESERQELTRYADQVKEKVIESVDKAIQDLKAGQLTVGSGEVTFARNRRVLKNGIWAGFGENPNGPVDHSLPVLRILDETGQHVRGLVFNYACHCTTFGGDYNRVNGDWAGYASQYLEQSHEGAVALCTIGCGADANPERNREHAFEIAQRQGREIADEIAELEKSDQAFTTLSANFKANFGFAGLPIDRPSVADLQESLKSSRPQVRRHAEVMLDTKKRMGRLPETYPMPIHVWRFGSGFAMVFLGGEVCVDYALRLKKELPQLVPELSPEKIWVSAYANDVFAYVAPESMRSEGGYEVDFSMVYYLQPGRWSSGTEEVIVRRIQELFESKDLDRPLSVNEALNSFTFPQGYTIEAIATEPLIRDPINFSVDAQGRMWVVEMGDYPRGHPEHLLKKDSRKTPWDGQPAGCVKVLTDINADGIYDESKVFLDGLSFPTGVFPWRDGALISGAPDLIFARDTNGDLICDKTEVLYSGFKEANPQHRVAGFEYGLDGWLYLSAGTNNGDIKCHRTGDVVNISGRDCRIHPESGRLEAVSGRSQYGRCRDDFDNWFGNTNSEPLFQYVIEDRELARNPFVVSPTTKNFLTEPRVAPPVFPTSRTLDRFNDLHALDRFTSACSPTVFRSDLLGEDVLDSILICEPVHNLISRIQVDRSSIEFSGSRDQSEQSSEFLSSSDNWFRPVRLMTAPDGTLWICDMYRHVIEHPQWIPEAWQAKLDLYAGAGKGRIYRLFRNTSSPRPIPDFTKMSPEELVLRLKSDNGWERDTAQQRIIASTGALQDEFAQLIRVQIASTSEPRALIQMAATLKLLRPDEPPLRKLYRSHNEDLTIFALRLWGAEADQKYKWQPDNLVSSPSERIRFQLALAAADLDPEANTHLLAQLLEDSLENDWIRAAVLSSASHSADHLIAAAINHGIDDPRLLNPLFQTAVGDEPNNGLQTVTQLLAKISNQEIQFKLLLQTMDYLSQRNVTVEQAKEQMDESTLQQFQQTISAAAQRIAKEDCSGSELATIIGMSGYEAEITTKVKLQKYLGPENGDEVRTAAMTALLKLGRVGELIDAHPSLTPRAQAEIQTAILTLPKGEETLQEAIESGRLTVSQLSLATQNSLRNSQQAGITEQFTKLATQPSQSSKGDLVLQYVNQIPTEVNSHQGQKLFADHCATCHRHHDVGNQFGPQFANLKSKNDEYFYTAILDPNAAVESKFQAYTVATVDGKIYTGLIAEETATSLKLVNPDGKVIEILRQNIEQAANTERSFMPEGLEKKLTPADIAHIIAFIRS